MSTASPAREPGWLLPHLLQADADYQGRWQHWHTLYETNDRSRPIPPIAFVDPGTPEHKCGLQHVQQCLRVISHSRATTSAVRLIPDFVAWCLWSLGYPHCAEPSLTEPDFRGASERLAATLDLTMLLRCPADYFGYLLAQAAYNQQWGQFYPTPHFAAQTMAHLATLSAEQPPPFHLYEPCAGTGRLLLAASHVAIAATVWERDRLLLQCALLNCLLYAPCLALPLPALAGDWLWGDVLTGQGRSLLTGQVVEPDSPTVAPQRIATPTPQTQFYQTTLL